MTAVVRSKEAESLTVTKLLVPLKERALPNRPDVLQVAPEIAPLFPRPERSATVVPVPSLKLYAATRPGTEEVDVGLTVSVALLVIPELLAVRVIELVLVVLPVLMEKFAVVAPPATVTLDGTGANAEFELAIATAIPPEGAAAESVTVPVTLPPLVTEDGFTPSATKLGEVEPVLVGESVSEDDADEPLAEAVMFAVVLLATPAADAEKFAVCAPVDTVTDAGTESALWLLVKLTITLADAAAFKVTVQAVVPGVCTEVGVQLREDTPG